MHSEVIVCSYGSVQTLSPGFYQCNINKGLKISFEKTVKSIENSLVCKYALHSILFNHTIGNFSQNVSSS